MLFYGYVIAMVHLMTDTTDFIVIRYYHHETNPSTAPTASLAT